MSNGGGRGERSNVWWGGERSNVRWGGERPNEWWGGERLNVWAGRRVSERVGGRPDAAARVSASSGRAPGKGG
jgi:hypothetical protein